MKPKQPKKAVIEKIDRFEIHLKGDSIYYDAKTKEEAEKIAKELEEKSNSETAEYNDMTIRQLEIFKNLQSYPEHLKKQLWHMTRNKEISQSEVGVIKKIMNELQGILDGTKRLNWHQGYLGHRGSYSVEEVKK